MMRERNSILYILTLFILSNAPNTSATEWTGTDRMSLPSGIAQPYPSDPEEGEQVLNDRVIRALGCVRASGQDIQAVDLGNQKLNQFLARCYQQTANSHWCDQLVRPNPDSHSTFDCTYSPSQPHYLIHPDERTWKYAFTAIELIQELEKKGINVCLIYNWWRPEPYNKNVGGAAGRHPYGTSVDVRFCSNSEANRAFDELCIMRKQGRLRAIGHYGTSALHFGIGDNTANTWGRSCK